jgi:hypothetical protein
MSLAEFCVTIMLVYISHSSSDSKLYKSLRDQCEAKGFSVVKCEKSFGPGDTLTEKGKRRIERANVAIVLLTAFGRASYRVFREADFIAGTGKDHFIIEGFGRKVAVKRKLRENHPLLGNGENYFASLVSLDKLLHEFSAQLKPDEFNFIYHTDLVY